jgi:hypothetical protein
MKIYGQDLGYRGAIFVIANSQEEAIELLKDDPEFNPKYLPLDEYDIKLGEKFGCMGDA